MNCRRTVHSWNCSDSAPRDPTSQDALSEGNYNYSSRSTVSDEDVRGLKVRNTRDSRQKLVFSDEEICGDILATLPKLHAAVRANATGDRWKHSTGKGGVYLAEMKPYYSSVDPDDDLDLLHAVAAKTELRCHLNEALSVLLHQDSDGYDSTMKSVCGKRFKGGEVLYRQCIELHAETDRKHESDNTSNRGAISVRSATIRPNSSSMKMRLQSRHNRTQQLVFSTYTRQYPDKKHAVHLMKTVPKDVHDQVLPSSEISLLRGEIDHMGVGFDLQFTPHPGGSNRQCTRIFAHAYASDKPSPTFNKDMSEKPTDPAKLARRRVTTMNPEARHIMQMLTEPLSQFERVIRRRRFGFQSFIYFPKEYADPLLEKRCLICNKTFHFFRRDFYCQLCGHMVCGDCSELYEVEARIGEIRKNRCCRLCVVRVDACKFDDEDLLPALGPIIVETPPDAWFPTASSILSSSSDEENQDVSMGSTDDNLMENLCSEDPEARSRALEMLGKLVGNSSSPSSSASASSSSETAKAPNRSVKNKKPSRKQTQVQQVLSNIENHLNDELSKAYLKSSVEACDVSDRTRDYKYEFDAAKVAHEDIPLAPKPEAQKEARRVELIKNSGALQSDYDRSALNLIAQVAAKRLGCSIGVVSMIDDLQFHAVGNYNLPVVAHHLPRDEVPCMHSVYAEKPLVLKNPQRDMRFSKMPCVDDFGVKFYAGFPLRAPGGEVIGNLCALDGVAHNNISTKDYSTMETLAKLASDLLAPNTGA